MKILITGSAGYIGGCCYEFLKKKFIVYGLDKVKPKLKKQKNFFLCNLNNKSYLEKIFIKVKPNVVIHLAGQSTLDGIDNKKKYKLNNLKATNTLLNVIKKNNINFLIFSSTAAVYKKNNCFLKENSFLGPNNIYGSTKLKCEKIIKKLLINSSTRFIILRFFNVCSSFYKEKIGEFHSPETHFVPIVLQKIINNQIIKIYGNNYKTQDGTCVRDYIHIVDLLFAIYKCIIFLKQKSKNEIINLGSNLGYSNLQILKSALKILKRRAKCHYENFIFTEKRPGDSDFLVCSNKKAKKIINWKPRFSSIKKIINDEILWINFLKKKQFNRKTIY